MFKQHSYNAAIHTLRRHDSNVEICSSSTTRNGSVNGFLYPLRPLIEILASLDTEIKRERLSWMQSGAAAEFADRYRSLLAPYTNLREMEEMIKSQQLILYGEARRPSTTNKAFEVYNQKAIMQFPRAVRDELNAIADLAAEHSENYENAMEYIFKQRDEIAGKAIDYWTKFIIADYKNPKEFLAFLTSEEYAADREAARPFLTALERHRRKNSEHGDFLRHLKAQLLGNETAVVKEATLQEFVKFLETSQENGNKSRPANSVLETLALIAFPAADIPGEVSQKITASGIFPEELKAAYSRFVDQQIASCFDRIKNELAVYAEDAHIPSFSADLKTNGAKRGRAPSQLNLVITADNVVSVPIKPEFTLFFSSSPDLTESEQKLSRYLKKLSRSDSRKLQDLNTIVATLRADPYGTGVKKLEANYAMHFNDPKHMPAPRWRYRADKREGVRFLDEESSRLRAIFYFDRSLGPHAIVLEAIMTHDEFDIKYMPGK